MGNYAKYFDEQDEIREATGENRWLKFLTQTSFVYVNAERIESVEHVSGKETLLYVMRTLDILDEICFGSAETNEQPREITPACFILSEVLKWSEVAKGGNFKERKKWTKAGYPLEIHNVASAMIFSEEVKERPEGLTDAYNAQFGEDVAYYLALTGRLIKTHGLIGQCIRGEIPVAHNLDLFTLSKEKLFLQMLANSGFDAKGFFLVLNECIIRSVSDAIWENVKDDVNVLIERILSGDISEFSAKYRLEKLCPKEIDIFDEDAAYFEKEIFPKYELWYFSSALSDFDLRQIKTIFETVKEAIQKSGECVEHINFKPLSDTLYYDYEGKKHINVYKMRIIEKYLKEPSMQNVAPEITIRNKTAFVDYAFSSVCEKLIDFCVEAERSGLLTFEKSIIVLYDMFGFRRDAFDRLNNEEKYLSTMNDVKKSTKDSIIDYAVGEKIVDVGSGGGILLDRLEKKFPEKTIIGTDISANVIDALNAKKKKEGHHWNVVVHNFVEGVFSESADTVIFSSILHEIYSYTETEKGRFEIESVNTALKNAFDSLRPGGRIIIRDGVKTEGNAVRAIRFLSREGLDFFDNYVQDFKGLKEISPEQKVVSRQEESLTVTGDINFLREFMYTYTWGKQSYAHEVQEQFGYYTLKEYVAFLESIGAKIIEAKEFLESGYPDNLSKYLDFTDLSGEEITYPASNCIIIAQK